MDMQSRSIGAMMKERQNPANWVTLTNQGATRNQAIAEALQNNIAGAIEKVYGPGYQAKVYSGGQPYKEDGGPRVGSTRHDGGNAADLYVYGPDGKRLGGEQLGPLAKYWLENSKGGVGGIMRGGGIHLDSHVDRPPFWTYGPAPEPFMNAVRAGLQTRGLSPPENSVAAAYAPGPRPAPRQQQPANTPLDPQQAANLGMSPEDLIAYNQRAQQQRLDNSQVAMNRVRPGGAPIAQPQQQGGQVASMAPMETPQDNLQVQARPLQPSDAVRLPGGNMGSYSHGNLAIPEGDTTGRYAAMGNIDPNSPGFLQALAALLKA
jgi:hypothetical protein